MMQKIQKYKRYFIGIAVFLVLCVVLSSFLFGKSEKGDQGVFEISDLEDADIGMISGAAYDMRIQNDFPKSRIYYYASYADMIRELRTGRIDVYVVDEPLAKIQVRETGNLLLLDQLLSEDSYGFVLTPENKELCRSINKEIAKLKKDGELDRLKEKWIESSDGIENIEMERPETEKGKTGKKVLRVATNADSAPFSYRYQGKIVGYDVELLQIICEKLGYDMEVTQYSFGGLLNSVVSGREDIAIGGITQTEERSRSMLFTDSVYDGGVVAVTRDSDAGISAASLENSIYRTVFAESRWQQILSGLLITMEISVVTLILGSTGGFFLSLLMQSKDPMVKRGTEIFSTVLDTIPVLIILMILYYVVFVGTKMPAIVIGTIGLSLSFANTVASLINTGIQGINPEQLMAAEAMGYRREQIYYRIAFPQAIRLMYSQYIGAVASMVKDTSIVGYITVQDLTSVTDTIRSVTYQAFFPLLLTAVIYFLISKLLVMLLSHIMRKMDPKYRPRKIKGVDEI